MTLIRYEPWQVVGRLQRQIDQMLRKSLRHMDERFERARHAQESHQIRTCHDRHTHERCLPHGLAQTPHDRPCLAAVIRRCDDLVPLRARTGDMTVDIGDRIPVRESQRRMFVKECDHGSTVVEKCVGSYRSPNSFFR